MLQLAWKRLKNRRSQNTVTVLNIFICVTLLFFLSILWRSFTLGLEISSQRLGADLVVVPQDTGIAPDVILYGGAPANIYMSKELEREIRELPGIKQVTPQFFAYTLSEDCCDVGLQNRLIGYDPQSDWVIKPWLADRNLEQLADDEIILGSAIFYNKQSYIKVLGKSFKIAGVLEKTGTSLDRSLMVNLTEARNLVGRNEAVPLQSLWQKAGPPEGLVSAILVKIDQQEDPNRIAAKIKELGKVDTIIASDLIKQVGYQYRTVITILSVVSLLVIAGTMVQLFLRFYSSSFEHRLEWGLYQAVGARSHQIAALVVLESLILTGTGAILGLTGGYSLFKYVEKSMLEGQSIPFIEPVPEYLIFAGLILVIASLGFAGLASSLPAYRSSRIEPSTVMLRGEYD